MSSPVSITSKKPGYDIQPNFIIEKPILDPNWTAIKSKKSDDGEFFKGNCKRIKRFKAKKNVRVINLEEESLENVDAPVGSEPQVNILIKHFEERLEIMKKAYVEQCHTCRNDTVLDCATSPDSEKALKLQPSKNSSSDEISAMFSKLCSTQKKVRFSDRVGVAEFSSQNYFKSRIFYSTAIRSKISY